MDLQDLKTSRMFVFTFIWIQFALLVGCSSTPEKKTPQDLAQKVSLTDSKKVKSLLLRQYKLWKGAPYQYGGMGLNGVDCSAFVQNTFKTQLGYRLPRTTRTQIKQGKSVPRSQLKVGDVVFFKVSNHTFHNGIYIGHKQFIHASTSKGVTISKLDNPYWRKYYYSARRIQ